MSALLGMFWFGLTWVVMSIVFGKLFGRPMNFLEGFIYPIILIFTVAIISGKLGPSKEERLAQDIEKYNRLTDQVKHDDAKLKLLDECVRQHRASDPDCRRAATGVSND